MLSLRQICDLPLAVLLLITAGCSTTPPISPPAGPPAAAAPPAPAAELSPRAPDDLFAHRYFPDSAEEVARARYAYLVREGTFDGLLQSPEPLTTLPEWQTLGPFGARAACPGVPYTGQLSGRVISLEQDRHDTDILYLGSASGGLWRSTNDGASWSSVFDNLPHPSVAAITSHPVKAGHVWIGTGDVGGTGVSGAAAPSLGLVFRSEDSGLTWTPVVFETGPVAWVSRIVLLPQASNQDLVFLATDEGVYKSSDYGDIWTLALDGPTSDLAVWGHLLSSAFELVAAPYGGSGLLTTTGDDLPMWFGHALPGGNWPSGRIRLAHSHLLWGHKTLYANVADPNGGWEGIWRSPDFGGTWTKVTVPETNVGQMNYNNTIAVDYLNPDLVYTGANIRTVYKSEDGGATWLSSNANPNGYIHEDQQFILALGVEVYVANDGGVFKSWDYGDNWQDLGNFYLQLAQTYFLTVSDGAGGIYDGSRYYIGTQDNGIHRGPSSAFLGWDNLTCCDGMDIAMKDGIPYVTLVGVGAAHTYQYPPGGDVCGAWTSFQSGLPGGAGFWAPLIYDGTHFYTKQGKTIYRADNGSLPWNPLATFSFNVLTFKVSPDGFIVAGADGVDQVWISNDAQTMWERVNPVTFWEDRKMTGVAFGDLTPSGRQVLVTLSGISGKRLVMSDDSGGIFYDVTNDLPGLVDVRAPVFGPDQTMYVGSDLGVFVSSNGGTTWRSFSGGLPAVAYVSDMEWGALNGKLVLATYGRGVFMNDPIPAWLFADGFESGDVSAWSTSVP